MSRSVHTSRAKFRKAFRFSYSTDEERTQALGKIIDEIALKRAIKLNIRLEAQSKSQGFSHRRVYAEDFAVLSGRSLPSTHARKMVREWNRKGYA